MLEVGDTWLVLGVAPGRSRRWPRCRASRPAGSEPAGRQAGLCRLAATDAEPKRQCDSECVSAALLLARCWSCCRAWPLAQALPAITSTPAPGGGTQWSLSIQTLLLLTSLTFLPALLLMMTSFTRIIIVLSLLRHALGTQTSPPNQVLVGLALFLTFFIMAPVVDKIYTDAYLPLVGEQDQLPAGARPGRRAAARLHAQADPRGRPGPVHQDRQAAAHRPRPTTMPMRVLIPAFVTSELKTAFQIGFIVFIPFLIIDMVVASVLMSMGMMMMSPVIVSLPFKIMLFVLVDGWNLLIGSLVSELRIAMTP